MNDKATLNETARPVPPGEVRARGRKISLRGEDEFHQCWFPVALSSEVAVGQVIGAPFLDGRVVIYRTSDGAVHVHSAYCRHLGADLSIGKVVDDRLRCPFHFWRYDGKGVCAAVPAGDPPPRQARLFDYPAAESLGIIWAFNGETPIHPVPRFELDEEDLVVDAFRNPLAMQVDSSIVFLNGFDLQHFKAVHGMAMEVDESQVVEREHTLTFKVKVHTPEFGDVELERKLWGTSSVSVQSVSDGRKVYLLHSLCPTSAHSTQGFLVNATPKVVTADPSELEAIQKILAQSHEYSLRLVNEDAPIFDTIRFRADCMTASDRFLAFGIRYIRNFPRAHPGRELIQ